MRDYLCNGGVVTLDGHQLGHRRFPFAGDPVLFKFHCVIIFAIHSQNVCGLFKYAPFPLAYSTTTNFRYSYFLNIVHLYVGHLEPQG